MSDTSLKANLRPSPVFRRHGLVIGAFLLLGLAALAGCIIGKQPLIAMLVVALAGIVLATPFVETLAVLTFWLLPYLILNMPAGGMTLKVPEVTAYLFATAALARALMRREPVTLPPATPQVLVYLGVVAISGALSPLVPVGMEKERFSSGFQGADLRPVSMLFWLILSWLVVVALYHVAGTSPSLYRRCVRAHILSGAISSLIGIIGYVLTLRGSGLALQAVGNGHSFVYNGGALYELTGVSYEPLLLAFYLVTVMPVSLTVALYRTDWIPRWLSLTAFLLQALALLLTFSAGGWVALALALVVLGYLFFPRGIRWNWQQVSMVVVGMLIPLGLVAAVYFDNPIIYRTMNDAVGKIANGGYKMRDDENLTGIRIWQDNFWLGAGPGMTPLHFLRYHPVAFTEVQAVSIYVNNLYINTLAETGLLGLVALFAAGIAGTFAIVKVIRRCKPTQVPVLTALFISLVGCAIQYWETQNLFLIYFPVLIGLTVSGARLAISGEREAAL